MLKQLENVKCLEVSCFECPFRLDEEGTVCIMTKAKREFKERLKSHCEKCGHIMEEDDWKVP